MAVGDLAFYYTLYLWSRYTLPRAPYPLNRLKLVLKLVFLNKTNTLSVAILWLSTFWSSKMLWPPYFSSVQKFMTPLPVYLGPLSKENASPLRLEKKNNCIALPLWVGNILVQYVTQKYIAVPGPLVMLVLPAVAVCGWCKLTSDLDPTPVRVILIVSQVCKWVQIYIFRLSYKLTSDDLWPWLVTFWPHEHTKVPISYQ